MKRMDLLDALGNLDEKYTKEADARAVSLQKQNTAPIEMLTGAAEEPPKSHSRRPAWLRAMTGVAAAAVFALSVGTVAKVVQNVRRTPGSAVASSGTADTEVKNFFIRIRWLNVISSCLIKHTTHFGNTLLPHGNNFFFSTLE